MIVGIDATNLRGGGGRTYLLELLRHTDPSTCGVRRVIIWAGQETLDLLETRPWLIKICPDELNRTLLWRSGWQFRKLSLEAVEQGCDMLFVPGGSFAGDFRPFVTVSQNMLPFVWKELFRYGFSLATLKLELLRFVQGATFRRADGVIYLTTYAKQAVQSVVGTSDGLSAVISHGLNRRFIASPRVQKSILDFTPDNPYRIIYVSIIDVYKHQWRVVKEIARLRDQTGWPLTLDLVGSAQPTALKYLNAALKDCDPEGKWVRYLGFVDYANLSNIYSFHDLAIFASTCENLPLVLMEAMASGLPVACSSREPMPGVIRDAAVLFDPESRDDLARVLRGLISSPKSRERAARSNCETVAGNTWEQCSIETFEFLRRVRQRHATGDCAALSPESTL